MFQLQAFPLCGVGINSVVTSDWIACFNKSSTCPVRSRSRSHHHETQRDDKSRETGREEGEETEACPYGTGGSNAERFAVKGISSASTTSWQESSAANVSSRTKSTRQPNVLQ